MDDNVSVNKRSTPPPPIQFFGSGGRDVNGPTPEQSTSVVFL